MIDDPDYDPKADSKARLGAILFVLLLVHLLGRLQQCIPLDPPRRPAVAALVCLALLGCSGAQSPDALAVAIALSNGAAVAVNQAKAAHEASLRDLYEAFAMSCRTLDSPERRSCLQQAGVMALNAMAEERVRINALVLLQQATADHLDAAKQCRADKLTCEAEQVKAAERSLATLRGYLARDGGL